MHKRNMPIAPRARTLKRRLTLLRRLIIPVTRVDIVRDDAVPQLRHDGQHAAAGREVRRAHVRGLYADDVDERLLEARHLAGEFAAGHAAKVLRVGPRVRGDLVPGFVGVLQGGFLPVDAAWER